MTAVTVVYAYALIIKKFAWQSRNPVKHMTSIDLSGKFLRYIKQWTKKPHKNMYMRNIWNKGVLQPRSDKYVLKTPPPTIGRATIQNNKNSIKSLRNLQKLT